MVTTHYWYFLGGSGSDTTEIFLNASSERECDTERKWLKQDTDLEVDLKEISMKQVTHVIYTQLMKYKKGTWPFRCLVTPVFIAA